jgi:Glycosyltransferase family 87
MTLRQLATWLVAITCLGMITLQYLEAGQEATAHPPSSDFYKFYVSAERWHSGKSPYWIIPPRIKPGDACHPDTVREKGQPKGGAAEMLVLGGPIPCLAPNLNPPIFMALMAPLAKLPYPTAWWIWGIFSVLCAWASVWLMTGTLGMSRRGRVLACLVLITALFGYYPHFIDFALGQVGSVLMLPLTLGWLALRSERPQLAGIWWGLAASLKPFLLMLVLALLVLRQWRACLAFALTALALGLIGLLWMGWDVHDHYRMVAAHVTWTTSNWNASIPGLVDRAFSGLDPLQHPEVPPIRRLIIALLGSVVVLSAGWLLHRGRRLPTPHQADLAAMLGMPTVILVSPLGWLYYLPWLMLPGFVAWHMRACLAQGRAWNLALLVPLVATLQPIGMKPVPTPRNPTIWWGMDALYGYALLGTWLIVMLMALAWLAAMAQQNLASTSRQ